MIDYMDSAQIEQKQSFGLVELLAWAEINRKPLLLGAIVVVAAIVGVSIYNWNQDRVETEANEALASIPWLLGTGGEDTKPDPSALNKIAGEYPGTISGQRAAVLAGVAFFDQGNFSEAQTTFSKFLGDHPDSPLTAQAAIGVASSLDAQGKYDEALAKYTEITRNGQSSGATEIKLNMARIYEKQHKPDQALAIYASLKSISSRSQWGSEVEERERQLLLAHPELAKPAATNAAPNAIGELKVHP